MTWSPPDWLLNAGGSAVVLGVFIAFLRMVGPWRKQITDTEERLRHELVVEKARCESELRVVRHRERGSRQIIYSLLHLVNMPEGERRTGALESVRATLAELERVESEEAAAMLEAALRGQHAAASQQ